MTEAEYATKERARYAALIMNRAIDRLADNWGQLETTYSNWQNVPVNWETLKRVHDEITAFRKQELDGFTPPKGKT